MHGHIAELKPPRRFTQELRLSPVGLDEMDLGDAHDGEHQPRQAGAAAEIGEPHRCRRQMAMELGRIQDMPPPGVRQGRAADKIDRLLPLP
jgi:hypothetical protein